MQNRLISLLACLICSIGLWAVDDDELKRLEADMLNCISSNNRDSFYNISEKLKEACKEAGDERLFYSAWSNQAVYEATHQNYARAVEIAKALSDNAKQQKSNIGQYFASHTEGFVLMQKGDYQDAEKALLNAVKIRHQYFPKESAAEDYRELMKIAYLSNDNEQAREYGNKLLAEPNLAPHHKGRTLYRLSIMAFDENNVDEFNHVYEEMKRLRQTDGIRSVNLFTEVNYHIINGEFRQALHLAELLSADTCAERKAIIYHRMGDNEKAYEYMALYKHISDSITRSSHSNTVASLYLRMNNDRLRLEREVLERKNAQLHNRFYIFGGVLLIAFLVFLAFRWRRVIRLLKHDKLQLEYEKKDAERALEDLNELSFYESKDTLPLTSNVRINDLCSYLTSSTQSHCHKGVSMVFLTDLQDDMEIKTNSDALKILLKHLLDYSARFTREGTIKLSCTDAGDKILFGVTDTSEGLGGNHVNHHVGMFSEHGHKVRYVGMNFNICQSITRLLQGRIWHDVEYTKGTRFCFELPKVPKTIG